MSGEIIDFEKEYPKLIKENERLKQYLNAAMWLLVEYANLPDDCENGNTAFGIDEGIALTNDLLRNMGETLGDANIFHRAKFEKDKRMELEKYVKKLKLAFELTNKEYETKTICEKIENSI